MNYKVKDILKRAIAVLSLDGKFNLEDETDADVKFFVTLLGMIASGIAYKLPLTARQEVTSDSEGKIYYGELMYPFAKLVSVTKDGAKLQVNESESMAYFRLPPFCSVTVEFVRTAGALTLDGELPFSPSDCEENVFVYAVCSEYCFVEGMFDEAEKWREKYAAAFYVKAPKRTAYLKERQWL